MSNKFTQKAQNTLNHALNIARELGHSYIGSEHIRGHLPGGDDGSSVKLLGKFDAHGNLLREIGEWRVES